jgi:electron transfer flavoprotein alpha subunit
VNIAVIVKQVVRPDSLQLMANGRLQRDGVELEMNAYCRRAVSQGVALSQEAGSRCVVYTLGPPAAESVLREAVAWGADEGVLITDPAFAGSDTLATARALAAALRRDGPWDLVLAGRNSVDADTGQVGPQVAELLDLPFAAGVRELSIGNRGALVLCELDDGWRTALVTLPALLSVAERLIEPCKMPPEACQEVSAERIRRIEAADLGAGPWGESGSPTRVGPIRILDTVRRRVVLSGTSDEQARDAVDLLNTLGALREIGQSGEPVADILSHSPTHVARSSGRIVGVAVEPDRTRITGELLGEAAGVADAIGGRVVAIGADISDPGLLGAWGADEVVTVSGVGIEEDVATSIADWAIQEQPWALLAPSTLWGREVAARVAVRIDGGLTGDAIGLAVEDDRLVCWKPAFGARLVAGITTTSTTQLVTIRPGIGTLRPRASSGPRITRLPGKQRGRLTVLEEVRDDDVEAILSARAVVCVGQAVPPDEYDTIEPLLSILGAELGATRKVTDKGWLPRARQIGLTGHSIAPALYIGIGTSAKFNHIVGVRRAGTVVMINSDPEAARCDWSDIGLVGDWREIVPALTTRLAAALSAPA